MRKLYMIGNTHFDPVWLWKWEEAMASIRATFRSALDRMKEDEGFLYSFATPPVFEWIRKTDEALFEEIKKRVAEGRWELAEGWWVQPDCYSACGESYVRQGLYAQKYWREQFGLQASTVFNVDSFGHSPALPQILRKSHINHYCFVRPEKQHLMLEHPLFWWKGLDGSRILAYRFQEGWSKDLDECVKAQDEKEKDLMLVYGVTDHGGAPTKRMLTWIHQREEAEFSGVGRFFQEHSDWGYTVDAELLTGDFGVFSNNSRIKRLNRRAEYALLNAEKASLIGGSYEDGLLEHCWQDVLFNQFHDILGGACIKDAYFDAENTLGRAIQTASEQMHYNLQRVTAQMKTVGENPRDIWNLVVWNLNGFAYEGYLEAEVQWAHEFDWYDKGIELGDEEGNRYPCQIIRSKSVIPGFRSRFVFHCEIPSVGYKMYRVIQTGQESPICKMCSENGADGGDSMENGKSAGDSLGRGPERSYHVVKLGSEPFVVETETLRICFSGATGCIQAVSDRSSGEVLCQDVMAPRCYFDDGDTWAFNIEAYDTLPRDFVCRSLRVTEDGTVRIRVKGEYQFGDSLLVMYYTFYQRERYVDISYRVNWNEKHYVLKLETPVSGKTHLASVPYGSVERRETRADVPVGTWLRTEGFSLGLDGIFAYNLVSAGEKEPGGILGLTLLRSPICGDFRMGELDYEEDYDVTDQGISEGGIRMDFGGGTWEMAERFLNPPVVIVEANHDGELPAQNCYYRIQGEGVSLSAVKKCEYDDSRILRMFEQSGVFRSVVLEAEGKQFPLEFAPFEIRTMKLMDGELREYYMTEDEEMGSKSAE